MLEAEKFRQLLKKEVDLHRVSLRQLDRLTKRSANYWSQVFRGKPRMTVDHVFEVLEVLEVEPEDFLRRVADGELELEDTLDMELLVHIRRAGEVAARIEARQRARRGPDKKR
jgi:hypothetical protein